MHWSRIIASLSVVLFCTSTFAQGWDYYTSRDDNFRIRAPGAFEVTEFDFPSEYGAVMPARIHSYESGDNRFSITVVDYTDARAIHAARSRTEADYEIYWEIDIRASVAYAATQLRQRGGEVKYDAYHYIDRVEGHQLQITNDDGSRTYAAIYLHDSHLYILEATVGSRSPPPVMFQQSLEFLNDDGNRIRYRNYEDAIKVRDGEIGDIDRGETD